PCPRMLYSKEKGAGSMIEKIYDAKSQRVPLYSWASELDAELREQALSLTRMPYVHHHVALMPDAPIGIGATIGSVFGAVDAVVPSAVGMDIGCGVIAIQIAAPLVDDLIASEVLANTLPGVHRAIPLAVDVHRRAQPERSNSPLEGFTRAGSHDDLVR